MCPRCKDKVSRVEQAGLGSIFLCTQGGSRFVYRERERLQVRYIYSERMSEKVREERERQSNPGGTGRTQLHPSVSGGSRFVYIYNGQ